MKLTSLVVRKQLELLELNDASDRDTICCFDWLQPKNCFKNTFILLELILKDLLHGKYLDLRAIITVVRRLMGALFLNSYWCFLKVQNDKKSEYIFSMSIQVSKCK